MAEETIEVAKPKDSLILKLPEPVVVEGSPWDDDVLNRAQIAARLTNLIRTQSVPFVVSIDGYWGTGKTFMLERWQKDLEDSGFKAIYFNAWEDDFCDDSLLAILGQLSESFKEGRLKELAARLRQSALPLLRQNALGILKQNLGVTLRIEGSERGDRDFIDEYIAQRATKDEMKKCLQRVSEEVRDETGHPLVFIIDELDRCRPTFAIELLERVKHIFDVPNLVFVFGINRDELCKSIRSVYGEIEADVYLRRFFDMEFSLPEADAGAFCRHLFEKFELPQFFLGLSQETRHQIHHKDFRDLSEHMVKLWARFNLSLRDIDYCVRLVALVGKNLGPGQYMHPALLGLLIPLKFKNPTLYRRFTRGECTGSEVMNYVDELVPLQDRNDSLYGVLDVVETNLYLTDKRYAAYGENTSPALAQLKLARDPHSEELTPPIYISKKTRQSDGDRIDGLIEEMQSNLNRPDYNISSNTIGYVAGLIDFYQSMVRR